MNIKIVTEITVLQKELGRVCTYEDDELKRSICGTDPEAGAQCSPHIDSYTAFLNTLIPN